MCKITVSCHFSNFIPIFAKGTVTSLSFLFSKKISIFSFFFVIYFAVLRFSMVVFFRLNWVFTFGACFSVASSSVVKLSSCIIEHHHVFPLHPFLLQR